MNDNQLEFADQVLSYIYSREVFQALSEHQQNKFVKLYAKNEHFREILNVALSLQEVIEEVESLIPVAPDEAEKYFTNRSKSILNKAKIEDNIIYIQSDHFQKKSGPFIVCLQQGDEMKDFEQFCKGMIIALFDVCHRQRRDLYIIPFAESVEKLPFMLGEITSRHFDQFIHTHLHGVTKLQPALQEAVAIYEQSVVQHQTELIIISNHHFVDYNEEALAEFEEHFASRKISTSAIAMSEEAFNRQPLPFIEKIFFANE